MSSIKRHMEDLDARYQQGLELCIKAGAIAECENHPGTYYDGGEPVEAAYRLASRKVAAGEIEGSQQTVTDAIKTAYEDNANADCCEECAETFG